MGDGTIWATAEEALTSAEKVAREDGEGEAQDEVDIINVQRDYVTGRQGRDKEAQTIYNQVLGNKPSDIGLTDVASNKLITVNKDQNIFDSKKRNKAATVEIGDNVLGSVHHDYSTVSASPVVKHQASMLTFS